MPPYGTHAYKPLAFIYMRQHQIIIGGIVHDVTSNRIVYTLGCICGINVATAIKSEIRSDACWCVRVRNTIFALTASLVRPSIRSSVWPTCTFTCSSHFTSTFIFHKHITYSFLRITLLCIIRQQQ